VDLGPLVVGGAPIGGLCAGQRRGRGGDALHHPAVTAAVIGARTADEIMVDVSYLEMHIPGALRAELNLARQC
jgi:hypothetical protein